MPHIELFMSVCEARMLAERYRMEYNIYRQYSCLQGCTLLEVFQQWREA